MAEITAELDLEISRFRAALGKVNGRLDRFAKKGQKSGKMLGSGMAKGLKSTLLPAIAALGIGAGIGAIFTKSLKEAAADEQLQVSMNVLVGDSSEATDLMNRLREEAATTPLQFGELGDAAKKLLAFGSAAASVPGELRKIGDISSGIGAPIGEIAELYGKARVQGTLFAEDINQLTGRGIPVIQEFAKQLGVSESKVKKMGSEGKITFANLEEAFASLTGKGGLFASMLAKQAETLAGKWSTLKDGVQLLYLEFGKPIGDALKPILDAAIEKVKNLKDEARAVGTALADGIDFAAAAFETMAPMELFALAGEALKIGFLKAVNVLAKGVSAAMTLMKGDVFADKLEQASLRFREVILGVFADIAQSMASDDTPFGIKMGGVANVLGMQSRVAGYDADDLENSQSGKASLLDEFQKAFKAAPNLVDIDESDLMELERKIQKIRVKADERKAARQKPKEEKPDTVAPKASDIVPQLTSRRNNGQVSLASAASYFAGGNLQAEGNKLLAEIARNTRPKKESTKRPAPPTATGVFGYG